MATYHHELQNIANTPPNSSIVACRTDATNSALGPSGSLPPLSSMCTFSPRPPNADTMNAAGRGMPSPPIRAYSVQSSQLSAMVAHRSMSNIIADQVDNGTLELGSGDRDRARTSSFHHFRAGRYGDAANVFVFNHRVCVSVLTFLIMFGMTVAGLWLEIASQQQTVV